ncbi:methyltransferase domain-containing protein [Bacillus sp. SB49]|uniref:class I SAM-dependent methyltransferase n=1 Tax=Bacillus sp. SB49 TaxID=1071080 RepID=UPI00040C56A9|nr:class I SAM-dependent methyltransferase [Bacillus sp. SB49]QHT47473.1 methyltransferase domain-containing protein [Bacillus sp. SB49]
MNLERIIPYSHMLMKQFIEEGDVVIDGTCGNGHDTLFLTNLVGDTGHVYGFDIQKVAVENTTERLKEAGNENRATILHESHSQVKTSISREHKKRVQAAIYNLGYLPGSDKTVITKPEETLASVQETLSILKPGGLLVLVVYHGHEGGEEEKDALLEYLTALDSKEYHVLHYGFINQKRKPPFILAVEKH